MDTAIRVVFVKKDFAIAQLDSPVWRLAKSISIERYWSGAAAPDARHFEARLLWSANAFYVHFEANQDEPLVVSDKPDVSKKTIGVWDRDVCEIFIAPNKNNANVYFEFEIAPTGEWIDLGIEFTAEERLTDWEYRSSMESAAQGEKQHVVMAIKIPWKAFGKTPKPGDRWLGNLFRCVGEGSTRGYLAWQPTMTKQPGFHVPERFGEFIFVG